MSTSSRFALMCVRIADFCGWLPDVCETVVRDYILAAAPTTTRRLKRIALVNAWRQRSLLIIGIGISIVVGFLALRTQLARMTWIDLRLIGLVVVVLALLIVLGRHRWIRTRLTIYYARIQKQRRMQQMRDAAIGKQRQTAFPPPLYEVRTKHLEPGDESRQEAFQSRQPEDIAAETPPASGLLPPVSFLTASTQYPDAAQRQESREREMDEAIVRACREYSVEGEIVGFHYGPVVATFDFKPRADVKYARVVNLGDTLAAAVNVPSIRIDRIAGSSTIAIEIPHQEREQIALRDIIDTNSFAAASSLLTVGLGKTTTGVPIVIDLARMPHLLLAGAPRTGISMGLHTLIVSLLYKALPSQLRLLVLDLAADNLRAYDDLPHLLHPVVRDAKLASNALAWTVHEMENRYRALAECGVRNIEQYNAWVGQSNSAAPIDAAAPMAYVVVVITELAHLMSLAPDGVTDNLTRLAQKTRAVGIHLVIATERPFHNVITGVMKANLPARICYQVTSKSDSRTILDAQGAEKLLGDGDMLFLAPAQARMQRVHGATVSREEVAQVVAWSKRTYPKPRYIRGITAEAERGELIESLMDPKYDDAVSLVLSSRQATAAHLQQQLHVSHSRASRLLEIMELNGIIGPAEEGELRTILGPRIDDDIAGGKQGA